MFQMNSLEFGLPTIQHRTENTTEVNENEMQSTK